jgi:GST-like protein
MLGDSYTIVDMAVWGWARALAWVLGDELASTMKNVTRLVEDINAHPAAARVAALQSRHKFKDLDEDARRILFKHLTA